MPRNWSIPVCPVQNQDCTRCTALPLSERNTFLLYRVDILSAVGMRCTYQHRKANILVFQFPAGICLLYKVNNPQIVLLRYCQKKIQHCTFCTWQQTTHLVLGCIYQFHNSNSRFFQNSPYWRYIFLGRNPNNHCFLWNLHWYCISPQHNEHRHLHFYPPRYRFHAIRVGMACIHWMVPLLFRANLLDSTRRQAHREQQCISPPKMFEKSKKKKERVSFLSDIILVVCME